MAKQSAKKDSKSATKSTKSEGDIAALEDFIKSHVERKLLRAGIDAETAEEWCGKITTQDIECLAQECGYDDGSQNEDADGDTQGDEGDEGQDKPKGMKALGDGSWLKKLWDNRQIVAAIITELVNTFVLSDSASAGGDGSTKSASANQNS